MCLRMEDPLSEKKRIASVIFVILPKPFRLFYPVIPSCLSAQVLMIRPLFCLPDPTPDLAIGFCRNRRFQVPHSEPVSYRWFFSGLSANLLLVCIGIYHDFFCNDHSFFFSCFLHKTLPVQVWLSAIHLKNLKICHSLFFWYSNAHFRVILSLCEKLPTRPCSRSCLRLWQGGYMTLKRSTN